MNGTSTIGVASALAAALMLTAAGASAQTVSEDLSPSPGYQATHAYKGRVIGTESPPDQLAVGPHELRGRVIGGSDEALAPLAAPLPGYQVTHVLKGRKIGTEEDIGAR